jgi:hypothetical protein
VLLQPLHRRHLVEQTHVAMDARSRVVQETCQCQSIHGN